MRRTGDLGATRYLRHFSSEPQISVAQTDSLLYRRMVFGAHRIDDAFGLAKAGGFPIPEPAEFHSAQRRGCQVAPGDLSAPNSISHFGNLSVYCSAITEPGNGTREPAESHRPFLYELGDRLRRMGQIVDHPQSAPEFHSPDWPGRDSFRRG